MSTSPSDQSAALSRKLEHYICNLAIVGLIQLALLLPYSTWVRMMDKVVEHVIGPLACYRHRALDNLAFIWPQILLAELKKIASRCLNNVGRTFTEN